MDDLDAPAISIQICKHELTSFLGEALNTSLADTGGSSRHPEVLALLKALHPHVRMWINPGEYPLD
jgi:hypothetical protein